MMSDYTWTEKERVLSREHTLRRVRPLTAGLLLFGVWIAGCAQGTYHASSLPVPSKKVVVFEIKGPHGEEFTEALATRLCASDRTVVPGSKLGSDARTDNISELANLARRVGADAFVTGTITSARVVNYSQFVVQGNFELFDAKEGDQVGGIVGAEYMEDAEPMFWFRFSPVPANNGPYEEFIRQCGVKAEALAPRVVAGLAKHVAGELDKGLKPK